MSDQYYLPTYLAIMKRFRFGKNCRSIYCMWPLTPMIFKNISLILWRPKDAGDRRQDGENRADSLWHLDLRIFSVKYSSRIFFKLYLMWPHRAQGALHGMWKVHIWQVSEVRLTSLCFFCILEWATAQTPPDPWPFTSASASSWNNLLTLDFWSCRT